MVRWYAGTVVTMYIGTYVPRYTTPLGGPFFGPMHLRNTANFHHEVMCEHSGGIQTLNGSLHERCQCGK